MAHGGAGRGQGRKPGIATTATRRIIEQAEKDNVLPLQTMFDNIRFYKSQADELIAKLLTGGAPQLEAPEGEGATDSPHADIIEAIKQVFGYRKLMGEEAARAAQYVHPRQGYAGEEPSDQEIVPLAERLKAYARRDEIEAAGDNVVDMTAR